MPSGPFHLPIHLSAAGAAPLDAGVVAGLGCGGSTARSGGGVWIPNNEILKRDGVTDTPDAARTYLHSIIGDVVPAEKIDTYLQRGPEMLSFVVKHAPLKLCWVPNYSDYYPESPGGRAAGRSVEPKPFNAKKLGEDLPGLEPAYGKVPLNVVVMQQDYVAGGMHMRGFFVSDDDSAYNEACKLARKVNINLLDREPRKVVVYLDPHEFQSTWLGNKAVYRTRMAIADGGELIVLAPALKEFGEDHTIDRMIRKFGYRGTPATLKAVAEDAELRGNLSAAAHLIHGSSEDRFSITYCPGDGVTLDEVRSVGYHAVPYAEMTARYNPETLKDGYNTMPDGEEIFYISNPALGLWAFREKFRD